MNQERPFTIIFGVLMLIAGVLIGGVRLGETSARGAALDGDPPTIRHLTVLGHGTAQAQPDMATVHMGVQTSAPTVEEALARNTERVEALLQRLREQGIAEEDLQTSDLRITPRYTSPGDEPAQRELTGYDVTNTLRVTVRTLTNIGNVVDTAVAAGANVVHGISFDIATKDQLEAEARDGAIADARAKAEHLAQTLGVRLGPVLRVTESGGSTPPQPLPLAVDTARSSVPVEPGTQEVDAVIEITYALE